MSSEIMSFVFAQSRRNIWPFSKIDRDLRDSKELVQRLSVPESTKNFVFAIRVHEHDSTIYILSAQNLSQRSATDAECLIRELRPDAVVAQAEEIVSGDGSTETIPTSAFKVITRCILDKSFNEEKYESIAGNLVMEEIFGTSFNGHVLAAKKVAEEVGSSFMVLESPFVMEGLDKSLTTQHYYGYAISPTRFRPSSCVVNEIESESDAVQPFAISTYNVLVELHNRFNALPAIRRALDSARKMLSDVNKGEAIDREVLSEIYLFRNAVEGIRIAMNNAGRLPIRNQTQVQFSKLSSEDKSYALMADQLRSQAKKFKNIVAVVDASNLAGLRRHWETVVPQEVKDRSTHHTVPDSDSNHSKLKPVVATVGAGAGALTISKAIKVPASLNVFLTHTHEAMAFAFTKLAYPTKIMTGGNSMSLAKASLSAEKIGVVTQCILYNAEERSFSAMRAAFYRMMMRRRRAKPIGTLPLVMFGASLVTCAGLFYYEEGIECAAVTLPSARSIARLGRGIQNLREASRGVTRREDNKIQNAMGGLSQRLRNLMLNNYSISLNFKTKFGS